MEVYHKAPHSNKDMLNLEITISSYFQKKINPEMLMASLSTIFKTINRKSSYHQSLEMVGNLQENVKILLRSIDHQSLIVRANKAGILHRSHRMVRVNTALLN